MYVFPIVKGTCMRAHKAVSGVSSVRRITNNNMDRNLFDIFSTRDLIFSTHDLEVKSAFSSRKCEYFEPIWRVFIRKFPPKSFCFLTSPTSPFLLGLCGRALSGCR
jgi:hypothetical protein